MAMEDRETGTLIGSDKVEGTAVYGADDTKIGSIERVMIDKKSGRVSYAVLSFGGFLGIGDDHYPLPWQSLKYDTALGGYRTGITESELKADKQVANIEDLITKGVNAIIITPISPTAWLSPSSLYFRLSCAAIDEQGREAAARKARTRLIWRLRRA